MRKFYITLVLSILTLCVHAQETWNLKSIAQDITLEEFTVFVEKPSTYRKLKTVARSCVNDGEFEKAVIVYQQIVKKHKKNLKKEDVKEFYICLIKVGRIDDVPYKGLNKHDKEFPNLLKIAKIRREERDKKKSQLEFKKHEDLGELVFGFSIQDSTKYCVFNTVEKKLLTYSVENEEFKKGGCVSHDFKKKYRPVTMEKAKYGSKLFTVYDTDLGLYRLEIISDSFPKFPYNSRLYSYAMPWFDEKTQCLFFCTNDPKGHGGWDIAYSKLKKGSKNEMQWLKPEILDGRINTPFDEMFPSTSGDILLYSSDGQEGRGGLDNFAFDILVESVIRKDVKILHYILNEDGNLTFWMLLCFSQLLMNLNMLLMCLGRLNNQAKQRNIEQGKIHRIITHDLNSAISSIYSGLKLLDKDIVGDQVMIKRLESTAVGAQNLLFNVLKWFHEESNLDRVHISKTNVKSIIVKTIAFMSIQLKEKKIAIVYRNKSDVFVNINEVVIETVLRNLISNAIKFSYRESRIIIDYAIHENNLILSINDFGIGMSEDQLEQVNSVGINISTEGTEGELGNAIGLNIVKDLIGKYSGELTFNSKLNEGTKVEVIIPIVAP